MCVKVVQIFDLANVNMFEQRIILLNINICIYLDKFKNY